MHTEGNYKEIDDLLTAFFSGNTSKELQDELNARTQESEDIYGYVRARLEIWFSSEIVGSSSSFDEKKAYAHFKQRVTKEMHVRETRRKYMFSWKVCYRVAAVILILLLPLVGYWSGKENVKQTFSDVVVEAPMGAQTKLYLPDGTAVWLNASSRITYSQGFGVDDRILKLEGEGYFEVAKNERKPFEIETKELSLRVVGTKFNFKNYPDDEEVTVSLIDGKVALKNELKAMHELFLDPDERVVLNKRTGRIKRTKTNVKNANAWSRNELFFDEELLEDIAKMLMRSYNVKIEVADNLRNKRFYGCFKLVGNNVDDVLKAMAATKQMKYVYKNEKYVLY